MHKIDFTVPLSGSKLFDTQAYILAKKLCAKFPALDCEMDMKSVHIFGELNDYWYDKWNTAVFHLGEIDFEE